MGKVFISYSKHDRFFAELLEAKLNERKFEVWRDVSSIVAGEEWRKSIDAGIHACDAVVLAMSKTSCSSSYVTYEWAYALGLKKPLIPVMLEECDRHPKIEPIQYIDFRHSNDSVWEILLEQISSVTAEARELVETTSFWPFSYSQRLSERQQEISNKIRAYLLKRNLRMVSYDRIISSIDENIARPDLEELVARNPLFQPAILKGGVDGLAML